jgi:hypothetical protein
MINMDQKALFPPFLIIDYDKINQLQLTPKK